MPTWLIILAVCLAIVPGAVVILAGVIAMFFAPGDYDRRRKRLAEGLCVHCGFDLRGTNLSADAGAACPKCGGPPFQSPDPVSGKRE